MKGSSFQQVDSRIWTASVHNTKSFPITSFKNVVLFSACQHVLHSHSTAQWLITQIFIGCLLTAKHCKWQGTRGIFSTVGAMEFVTEHHNSAHKATNKDSKTELVMAWAGWETWRQRWHALSPTSWLGTTEWRVRSRYVNFMPHICALDTGPIHLP